MMRGWGSIMRGWGSLMRGLGLMMRGPVGRYFVADTNTKIVLANPPQ